MSSIPFDNSTDIGTRYDADIRSMVDIAPYPALIHHNGTIRYGNSLAKTLLKEEGAALNGKNLFQYVHEGDVQAVRDAALRYNNSDESHILHVRVIDSVGNVLNVQGKSISIQYEGLLCRYIHVYNFDRAEQALEQVQEKEEILTRILEIMPDSLLVTDRAARRILYSNKSMVRNLGYEPSDFTDEYAFIESKIHPEDLPKIIAFRQALIDAVGDQKFLNVEYRVQDKAGKWRWLMSRSISTSSVKLGSGHVNYSIVQDITSRKEKEQELLHYHSFQEKVNDTSPVLISIFDLQQMSSVYQSKNMVEWFRYTPETFPPRSFEVIHPDYIQDAITSVHQASQLQDGQVQTTVYPALQGDGTIKFLLTRTAVFHRDENGKATQVLMVHSDITDLKEIESRLDRSEETRKAILHTIPDMVLITDLSGEIFDFYPNELLRSTLSSMSFIGKNVAQLLTPDNTQKILSAVAQALRDNRIHTIDFAHAGRDMTYYMELRISPFIDDKVVIVARDIAEQKEQQDKIDHYNKELYAKNQELERYITSNSELEKFAYIASHDLREPLRSLTGFAQLLQKRNEGKLTRESEEFIENIINGAHRMNTLVSGLLEYSRITSAGKPFANVQLPDLIRKVKSDLKISIEENKADIILFDLPTLYCDELQMRQLFQNLISNAIKFRSETSPIIKISAEQQERYWLFRVEDNGIGLDPRYKEQVFQIFTRLHSQDKYQGSGIGLSVCKKIIERHGGRIWLESTPGHGATIFFTVAV